MIVSLFVMVVGLGACDGKVSPGPDAGMVDAGAEMDAGMSDGNVPWVDVSCPDAVPWRCK
jgi:hypothetical protein